MLEIKLKIKELFTEQRKIQSNTIDFTYLKQKDKLVKGITVTNIQCMYNFFKISLKIIDYIEIKIN